MNDNTSSLAPSGAPSHASPAPGRRRWLLILAGLLAVVAFAGVALRHSLLTLLHGPETTLEAPQSEAPAFDLGRPDALIDSVSLSRLPKELLEVPLLRETLSEDFVFYYEQDPDRLGLNGSLRRIVYEHELTLQDNLIEALLDQPAQVALWRGVDGRLRDFLVVMKRGGLARVLEPLARAASSDSQLSEVGEIEVDGDATAVYRLRYGTARTLLFASHGDYLLLLSNPQMLYPNADGDELGEADARAASELGELLDGEDRFVQRFGLHPRGELSQRITLDASVLAMGYQRFIPAFAGVRFDKAADGWHSYLALNAVEGQPPMDFSPVWQAMPMGASACVALPLTPGLYDGLLVRLGVEQQMAEGFSARLSGAAGLCWYAESRLHSPLLVATLDTPPGAAPDASLDDDLGKLFAGSVGAFERNAEDGRFPVEFQRDGDTRRWQRQVSSNFGQYAADDAEFPETISGQGFFRVGLARKGGTLLFSIDDQLLDKALATLDKRYPPLADVLPKDALVPAYLAPQSLSALLQRETFDSLPQDIEPVFRNAADSLLVPRLEALAGQRGFALGLPPGSRTDQPWQWLPLQWRPL